MRLIFCLCLLTLALISAQAQRVDGSFDFQGENGKKYSLFIPDSYDENKANPLMLCLHPFNPNRWDAEAWCDTLITFAQANGLILACPDGGADGRIDDPVDTAFTTVLLDSVRAWYNIDRVRTYAMGFSWGGKSVYTYGISRPAVFAGFMPVGAAINGLSEVDGILEKAKDKPVYIIHGDRDAPGVRYTPLKDELTRLGARVEGVLMAGVGHTIDFPDRNSQLTKGFHWIDSVQLVTSLTRPIDRSFQVSALYSDGLLRLSVNALKSSKTYQLELIDLHGRQILSRRVELTATPRSFPVRQGLGAGIYILNLRSGTAMHSQRLRVE